MQLLYVKSEQHPVCMKKPVLHSAFLALIGLVLSPMAVSAASSPPADSVHFCAFDHEQWRRDHPRPAAKPLGDLNAGEPRTVRMIYFLPNDWPYRADVVDSMKTVIKQSQTFYAEQMQAHGYGDETFRIETDAQGEPLVHRVDAQHPFSHYDNTLGYAVIDELEQTFDLDANIYFIVLGTDALRQGNGQPAGGVGGRRTKNGGDLVVPDRFSFFTVAHELGHTFGLYHDFRDNRYIMSYGHDQRGVLSACAAEFLAVHTYFNPDSPIEEGPPPTVELTSSNRYQPGTTSVPVRLKVSDSEGLHHVSLVGNAKPCRGLADKKEAVVEFDYDGSFWERGFKNLSDQPRHHIFIVAVDADGNVSKTYSSLMEISPYHVATLEGHTGVVRSVAFSPDGTTLASGSGTRLYSKRDGTVKLWDVATRTNIATLEGHTGVVRSVAFSPDGGLLASAGGWSDPTVRLWDAATQTEVATLRGHTDEVRSVSFSSPDGATLASGAWDRTVRLWDVATQEEVATLEEHSGPVHSVSFSRDGATLISGAADGRVLLRDVETGNVAGLSGHGSLSSMALSPDGTLLASTGGWGDETVTLWDAATRTRIATLEGHTNSVTSVSFSSDGALLASGSWDQTVKLWEVGTRVLVGTLEGHTSGVNAVAFSPDDATLASAGGGMMPP